MLGSRITKRREQLGLSQMDLARLLDVAPARISDFERGVKTDCNLSTAKRLAQVLGVSIDYLAGTWDEEPAGTPAAPTGVAASTRRRGRPRKAALVSPAGARG
jgi:transcriptional regulator with XRE-family HTH domain